MDNTTLDSNLKLIGGVLGIVAFLWNLIGYLWTYFFSHLQVDITNEIIKGDNNSKIKTTAIVENKGNIAKKIDFAFLLIKPEHVNFRDALLKIADQHGFQDKEKDTIRLMHFYTNNRKRLNNVVIDNQFVMYPLPYYYEEQFQIGNEKVKFSRIIDLGELQKNNTYEIRFVIVSRHLFKTYLRHRSTSDLFIN